MRLDTDDRNLEVPDFTAPAVTITEPLVFRGRTARDIQLLRAAPPPVPTAARTFSRTERLLLRFQAYAPAGQTPAITMRLLNQHGDNMAALPAPTAGDGGYEARPRTRAASRGRLHHRNQRQGRRRTDPQARRDPRDGLSRDVTRPPSTSRSGFTSNFWFYLQTSSSC